MSTIQRHRITIRFDHPSEGGPFNTPYRSPEDWNWEELIGTPYSATVEHYEFLGDVNEEEEE